jgi:hypothetical protein
VATRRLYAEQPDLWSMGERGRSRTLEDFEHHFRALQALRLEMFEKHVRYCHDLFEERRFPRRWLDDAWRIMDGVLADELPASTADEARAILHRATDVDERTR